VKVESREGEGSTFTLLLPLGANNQPRAVQSIEELL
jgi:signal transduction histidine kinase